MIVKKHILRFNRGNKGSVYSFEAIKTGVKKIETRAGTKKYQKKVKDIMPDRSSRKELEDAYFSYPDYKDKMRKFGLITFELE